VQVDGTVTLRLEDPDGWQDLDPATLRAALFGIPVDAGRAAGHARVDPAASATRSASRSVAEGPRRCRCRRVALLFAASGFSLKDRAGHVRSGLSRSRPDQLNGLALVRAGVSSSSASAWRSRRARSCWRRARAGLVAAAAPSLASAGAWRVRALEPGAAGRRGGRRCGSRGGAAAASPEWSALEAARRPCLTAAWICAITS
jgi:hypothetical protein